MNWFKKIFKKKKEEVVSPTLMSFSVEKMFNEEDKEDNFIAGLSVKDGKGFIDFLRNSDYGLEINDYSDQELAHLFVYTYCQRWIVENLKNPIFIETHSFPAHGEIKYDRTWNKPFINSISGLGFDSLPTTEEETADMYMNYIYGTRMMEELEAAAEAEAVSTSHPQLSSPNNNFKG